MKLTGFNFTPISVKNNTYSTSSVASRNVAFKGVNKVLNDDVFELGMSVYERALSKLRNITKEEYDSLTEVEKNVLRAKIESPDGKIVHETIKKDINYHHFATEAMKKVFDKQYGEENYVVITLGRSLSSILKLLGLKIGADNVKNIPMSGLAYYWPRGTSVEGYNFCINQYVEKKGFVKFEKYLDTIGLNRKTVENSGKNYVVMDFSSSGESLEAGYAILTSDKLLGNKKRNITFASMKNISDATGLNVESAILNYYLEASLFKKYSFVDKLNELTRIEKAHDVEKFAQKHTDLECKKIFGFSLLDSMHSGEKIPYSDTIEICEPIIPYKKIWNNLSEQYIRDVWTDSLEIIKAINRADSSVEKNKFLNRLDELQFMFKHQTGRPNYAKEAEYYGAFRHVLLKELGEL